MADDGPASADDEPAPANDEAASKNDDPSLVDDELSSPEDQPSSVDDKPSSADDEPSMLRFALRAAGNGFEETNREANERTRKRTAETTKIKETVAKKGQANLAIVMARN